MNVYEKALRYMTVYVCIGKSMGIYEPIWQYMKVYDNVLM